MPDVSRSATEPKRIVGSALADAFREDIEMGRLIREVPEDAATKADPT
jgi:hypothetical protein